MCSCEVACFSQDPADVFADANWFVLPAGIPIPDLARQLRRRVSGRGCEQDIDDVVILEPTVSFPVHGGRLGAVAHSIRVDAG